MVWRAPSRGLVQASAARLDDQRRSNSTTTMMTSRKPTEPPPIQMALARIGENSRCIACLSFSMARCSPSLFAVLYGTGRSSAMGCNPTADSRRRSPPKDPAFGRARYREDRQRNGNVRRQPKPGCQPVHPCRPLCRGSPRSRRKVVRCAARPRPRAASQQPVCRRRCRRVGTPGAVLGNRRGFGEDHARRHPLRIRLSHSPPGHQARPPRASACVVTARFGSAPPARPDERECKEWAHS